MSIRTSWNWLSFALLLGALGLAGCSKKSDQNPEAQAAQGKDSKSSNLNQASPKVSESLMPVIETQTSGELGFEKDTKYFVAINRQALAKDFLLQASFVPQVATQSFTGIKSKVVRFVEEDGLISMYESPYGHTVIKGSNPELLLAQFPIVKADADWIRFDANVGLKSLFVSADWYASDSQGSEYDYSNWANLQLKSSLIKKAEIAGNILWLQQNAVVDLPGWGVNYHYPLQLHYYLTPYLVNTQFQPTLSQSFHQFGYFEAGSILNAETGGSDVFASKFDVAKPIVYAISANTPVEYKNAVKEGVLYWNKVLGKELIQVIDAPAGVQAPHPTYNVIQWVDWDTAGGAYADAQMDPHTGEILHSQIFVTSFWVQHAMNSAKKSVLDSFELNEKVDSKKLLQSKPNQKSKVIGLKNLIAKEKLCDLDLREKALQFQAAALGQSQANLEVMAQHMVRGVVAHEVGHTLGLRHNFTGSIVGKDSHLRNEKFISSVVKDELDETSPPTSTVMDYPRLEEDMVIGHWLLRSPKPFEYDQKAISALYFGKKYDRSEVPPFCTDTFADNALMDCIRHDYGTNPLEYAKVDMVDHRRKVVPTLASVVLNQLKDQQRPNFGGSTPEFRLPQLFGFFVRQNPGFVNALLYLSTGYYLFQSSQETSFVLGPDRIGTFFQNDAKNLASLVASEGGFEKIFSLPHPTQWKAELAKSWLSTINSDGFEALATQMGVKLSPKIKSDMVARGQKWLDLYVDQYFKIIVMAFAGQYTESWKGGNELDQTMDDFGLFLKKLGAQVITSVDQPSNLALNCMSVVPKTKSDSIVKCKPQSGYTLPKFSYPMEARKAAAGFLSAASEDPTWSTRVNVSYSGVIKKNLVNLYGFSPKEKDSKVFAKNPKSTREFMSELELFDSLVEEEPEMEEEEVSLPAVASQETPELNEKVNQ